MKHSPMGASAILLVTAILSGIFALAVIAKPIIGQLAIVYATSLAFFFIGVYRVLFGVALMNSHRDV